MLSVFIILEGKKTFVQLMFAKLTSKLSGLINRSVFRRKNMCSCPFIKVIKVYMFKVPMFEY